MEKRTNFATATIEEIEDLCFNSTSKHALENKKGVNLSTIRHILSNTKKVDLLTFGYVIDNVLNKAVLANHLFFSKGWYTLPNHQVLYQRRKENIKNKRKWNFGLNILRAEDLRRSADRKTSSSVHGGVKGRKRKRKSQKEPTSAAQPANNKKQKRDAVKNKKADGQKTQTGQSKKHDNPFLHKGRGSRK